MEKLSSEEKDEFIASLKKKRRKIFSETPLLVLTINSIIKNHLHFMGLPKNPFEYLPNTIVQKILDKIDTNNGLMDLFSNSEDEKRSIPFDLQTPFVLRLLNSSVKNVGKKFWGESDKEVLFQHMLNNCPNIRHFAFENYPYNLLRENALLEISCRWKKLVSLDLRKDISNDGTLQLVQKYLPNLVEFLFFTNKSCFTMEGVKHLSNFLRLQKVTIGVQDEYDNNSPIWVHVAGKIPQLQNLTVVDHHRGGELSCTFVERFGKHYPNKKLTVEAVRLHGDLDSTWPPSLSVATMKLFGPLNSVTKLLSTISPISVKSIQFFHCSPPHIYSCVEKLGPGITEFYICNMIKEPDVFVVPQALDLFRVFTACPHIETFELAYNGLCVRNLPLNLTPRHFRNCHKFTENNLLEKMGQDDLLEIYKMFVIGTERCMEEFAINSDEKMEVIKSVLQQYENTCLERLQKVSFYLYCCKIETLTRAYEVAALLITRSPFLKVVKLFKIARYAADLENISTVEKSFQYSWLNQLVESLDIEFIDVICRSF